MSFPELEQLVRLLSSLPGIGQRSARRISFHLLKHDLRETEDLAEAMVDLRRRIRFCSLCGGLATDDVCSICDDSTRDRSQLCIVEEPSDIFAIESTGEYRGVYHVLMGALSPLDGIGPDELRIDELENRLKTEEFNEWFIATNPTLEGDATASYLSDRFRRDEIQFTRISHGIPTGSGIEFADRSTLARSIRERKVLH
ncbi:MAG: recombination protein RecR [Leptonema sp. (in: Bacteria)]|nr:recombination protein RecR [Leptonema sp. (in: bacteria)]